MSGIRTCRFLLAALLLAASVGTFLLRERLHKPAQHVASGSVQQVGNLLHIDPVERTFTSRAARGRVRPLEPPAAPDPQQPATVRPAPQRASRKPPVVVQPAPAPGACAGRMSEARAHACWDRLLAAYPWPTATAFRVLYCESTGDPNAVNGRYYGLMQVDGAPFDPAANIAAAYAFWVRRGWQPWECK